MKCLILAAGRGSRLQHRADSKPLFPFLGVPLIERTIRSALAAGADDFVVVTGYGEERLRPFLREVSRRLGVPVTTVSNRRWETAGNGASVLVAEKLLREPFLLLMADHLFDPSLLRRLIEHGAPPDGVLLAVDGDRHNPLVDAEDVTRVRRKGERIVEIGKGLEWYDGFDTGLFLAAPALFRALREAQAKGDTTLSGGVRRLAEKGLARALDVTGGFWCDLDDEAAIRRAERALLARVGGKDRDGPVSRWLNRPLSVRLSRWLARLPVTPNQISLFSFGLSLVAAWLLALPGYAALAAGGVLAQVASVIDGCDGEVARIKMLQSDYGGWLDAVLDRYADAFLLGGLTWHLLQQGAGGGALLTGFLALVGSFMVSYTADKYDGLMRERGGSRFRVGRDVRVFLVFLGAVLNLPLASLAITALVMNLETLRRLVVCREAPRARPALPGEENRGGEARKQAA